MRRPTSPDGPHEQSPTAPSPGADVWTTLLRPALAIGLVGACAVLYLVACARLSVIECDQHRLERILEDEEARELDLHRRLAELRNAEQIRAHIADRGLCRPVAIAHVDLTDVPPALCAALPGTEREEQGGQIRLGQLPPAAAGALYPAMASAP